MLNTEASVTHCYPSVRTLTYFSNHKTDNDLLLGGISSNEQVWNISWLLSVIEIFLKFHSASDLLIEVYALGWMSPGPIYCIDYIFINYYGCVHTLNAGRHLNSGALVSSWIFPILF